MVGDPRLSRGRRLNENAACRTIDDVVNGDKERVLDLWFNLLVVRLEDDDEFRAVVDKSLECLPVWSEDFSKKFGESLFIVQKWLSGRAMPHPAIRRVVKSFLERKCREAMCE